GRLSRGTGLKENDHFVAGMDLASADRFGRWLIVQHGLWRKGWRFRFDRAKRRLAHCDYQKKIISLSSHLARLNPASRDSCLSQPPSVGAAFLRMKSNRPAR